MVKILRQEMQEVFTKILKDVGFTDDKATACAAIFTTNSREGVYTHGVNRFPVFVDYVKKRFVDANATPSLVSKQNAFEQWDGHLGPGPLNAVIATEAACTLAKQHAIGLVGLKNTNHWMRGGYYAREAAKRNCILISWTNTIANMPVWGAKDVRLGNNPLVIGIPYKNEPIVLDMAMSQYAHGKIELYSMQHKALEVPGGYDEHGNPTTDADAILRSNRKMPMGYWKGAGLSLLLDILAMLLSSGQSVADISSKPVEAGLSQVFIAIDMEHLPNYPSIEAAITSVLEDYLASETVSENASIVYPGQRVLATRNKNLAEGIPVNEAVWQQILSLLPG